MDKTERKDRLGLDFPDCRDCDITRYEAAMKDIHCKKVKDIYSMMAHYEFFDAPQGHEGMLYGRVIDT